MTAHVFNECSWPDPLSLKICSPSCIIYFGAEATFHYFSVVDTLQLRLSIREARRAEAEAVAFEHMALQCQEGEVPRC